MTIKKTDLFYAKLTAFWLTVIFLASCSVAMIGSEARTSAEMRPYVTAGVLIAIDQSDAVTPQRVLEVVADIRASTNLDGTVTADELMAAVNAIIDLPSLDTGTRYVVTQLLIKIEDLLRREGMASADISATADDILLWIEIAARMSI